MLRSMLRLRAWPEGVADLHFIMIIVKPQRARSHRQQSRLLSCVSVSRSSSVVSAARKLAARYVHKHKKYAKSTSYAPSRTRRAFFRLRARCCDYALVADVAEETQRARIDFVMYAARQQRDRQVTTALCVGRSIERQPLISDRRPQFWAYIILCSVARLRAAHTHLMHTCVCAFLARSSALITRTRAWSQKFAHTTLRTRR